MSYEASDLHYPTFAAYSITCVENHEGLSGRTSEKATIFGSRVKGRYKPGSDVDIAIWGDDISFSTYGCQ